MIHVGLLFEYATCNGGEQSMLSVLRQLSTDARFRFSALAPATGRLATELRQTGVDVVPFAVRDARQIKRPPGELVASLQQTLHRHPVDVLHANSLSMCRLTGQLTTGSAARTGHLRDIIGLNRTVIRDLNANDRLIAVSAATRDFHVQQGLAAAQCEVIYNGVDTQRFCRSAATARQDAWPQIPQQATVVLNVGQICLRKGQRDLAQVIAHWPDERRPLHLVLVGERHSSKAESVAYEQELADTFAAAGRSDRLHRLGERRDVPQLMNAADLLVHTARQEPLGRVLLEAAACELPIIATDVGGTREILCDGRDAWLVPPASADALQQAILQAMSQPQQAADYAASARRRVCDRFAVTTAAENLAAFWQQAAGS